LNTGLMIRDHRSSTGYCSQVKRQAACFSKNDPNKMYWMGYFNSGMGFDDNGQWNPLSDRNWIENRKYDTALYEVDVTTGEANRIGVIKDRYMFAYMWVDGEQEPEIAGGLRGDVNDDGIINIDDVTTLIDYLLAGGAINMINADCDNTGSVTVGDVTFLIDYLLVGNW
ncbi:MAG: dockerin type I repeat-containing protein, partial [Muribaculaceae bacterium]|nr:dockerin type I repeat-containing protein [Muribaculaceae bacterium]